MTNTKKLGEVFEIRKGKKAAAVADTQIAGSFPYIQIDEVRGVKPTKFAVDPKPVLASEDDICIVWDGANAGTIGYGVSGAVGSTVARMRLKSREDWEPRFLGRLLEGKFPQLNQEAQGRGATIPHVDKARLEAIEFPRIPPAEQRRIAAILDKADAIRRKREHSLALADDFLKSAFLKMFGDPLDNPNGFSRDRIGDRLSKTRAGTQSGPFGSALKKHEYTDSGVPVWGVENVHPNRFIGEARLFISNEKYEDLKRYNVVRGDVLISRAGTVGRMCIAEPVSPHSIISTNLVRVSLDQSKLLPQYFVCLFTYFADRLDALRANNKEDAFTFLNPKTLREIKIPIPEIERQQKFVRLTGKLDGLIARAQAQRDGLSDMFSSLSQRAFHGEL
ncbi:MAG TPA: restriction endonuclease subunit S [Devosia sp.]|nr:restriction endonuclease subunit S [Devosia sp.]